MTALPIIPNTITLSDFGGVKKDVYPQADIETDLSASEHNLIMANVCQMSRTTPKAIVCISLTTATNTVVYHDAVWGNGSGVAPVLAKTDVGRFTLTFPDLVSDLLRDSGKTEYASATTHPVALNIVQTTIQNIDDGMDPYICPAYVTDNVVYFTAMRLIGAVPDDPADVVVFITVW